MPACTYTTKDPSAILDYTIDWSARLLAGEESIVSVEWFITGPDDALVLGEDDRAPTNDATSATCWLIGGTAGARYELVCRITTASTPSRVHNDFTIPIVIANM